MKLLFGSKCLIGIGRGNKHEIMSDPMNVRFFVVVRIFSVILVFFSAVYGLCDCTVPTRVKGPEPVFYPY